MKLVELFEGKPRKKELPVLTPRNFVAKNIQTSGAGAHTSNKHSRKEKHKKDFRNDH